MPPGGVRDPVPGRSGQDGCFRGFWRPPAEWFDAGYSIPPWGPDFRDFPGGAGGPGRPGVSRIGELLNTVPGVHPGRAPGGGPEVPGDPGAGWRRFWRSPGRGPEVRVTPQ
jgi:hypothetical protein